jgi:hypothetical protein
MRQHLGVTIDPEILRELEQLRGGEKRSTRLGLESIRGLRIGCEGLRPRGLGPHPSSPPSHSGSVELGGSGYAS